MRRRSLVPLLAAALVALAVTAAPASAATSPGHPFWERFYDPTEYAQYWQHASVAPDGGVVVAGQAAYESGWTSVVLAKYSTSGTRRWLRDYSVDGGDRLEGMAVDRAGNVYLAATANNPTEGYDILVLKYSAAGSKRWELRLGNVGYAADSAAAIALDAAGNVYVAGMQTNPGTGQDAVVIKLTPSGGQRYRTFYRGAGSDSATAVAVDRAGQAYVCGTTDNGDANIFLMKVSAAGSRLWAKTIDGGTHGVDMPRGLALGPDGVYVAADVQWEGDGRHDVAVARFTFAGARRWLRTYGDVEPSYETATSMAVDASGAAYVGGWTQRLASGGPARPLLVKWDAAGVRRWVRRLSTDSYPGGTVRRLVVGAGGAIYCVGEAHNPAVTDYDMLLAAYTPTGVRRWLTFWDDGAGRDDLGMCVAAGRTPAGTAVLYAGGRSDAYAAYNPAAALLRIRP